MLVMVEMKRFALPSESTGDTQGLLRCLLLQSLISKIFSKGCSGDPRLSARLYLPHLEPEVSEQCLGGHQQCQDEPGTWTMTPQVQINSFSLQDVCDMELSLQMVTEWMKRAV